jgi:hypothetical protein
VLKSLLKKITIILAVIGTIYVAGRLYFAITGGFTEGNINSNLSYDPRWQVHTPSPSEVAAIDQALDQPFDYLSKGCQSYVFLSRDGNYVIKFFKYQRFRPQTWFQPFTFIPSVKRYQQRKAIERKDKLDRVFRSCTIAYEHLPNEAGLVFLHLNKTPDWTKTLTIYDKMHLKHVLQLGDMEFIVQRRATLLAPAVNALVANGKVDEAETLIDRLFVMLLLEYARGYADNDHALMQNTGVLDGYPIHIDIGQFVYNEIVTSSDVYYQEMYDKLYLFYVWLKKHHPDLAFHLKTRLVMLMGPEYYYKAPYHHKGDVGKIPNQ